MQETLVTMRFVISAPTEINGLELLRFGLFVLNPPKKVNFENFTREKPLKWGFFCFVLASFAVMKEPRTLRANCEHIDFNIWGL